MVILMGSACKSAVKVSSKPGIKLSNPIIFGADFQKAIYKTDLKLYGKELSGITLIKKTGEDFRLVFLSEVGLKYFDLEFFARNDSVQVHHIASFLDKGNIQKMMVNNYRLICMTFLSKAKDVAFIDKTTNNMTREYRYNGLRIFYTYDKNFGQVSNIDNTFGRSNLFITLGDYDHLAPGVMNFNRPNLNMRLEKIEQ